MISAKPFIDPHSGSWWTRRRRKSIRWHRKQGHDVQKRPDLIGLPTTVCRTCHMSWTPVWGTGDTIVGFHPDTEEP